MNAKELIKYGINEDKNRPESNKVSFAFVIKGRFVRERRLCFNKYGNYIFDLKS